ncbi:hypothetical protein [Streptomyces incanus]|uniref:Uncharacterized protein n=1 Tax=Streptomyces incanus TaxID=887453 RepID=A0ABW0XXQ0_9ACTN
MSVGLQGLTWAPAVDAAVEGGEAARREETSPGRDFRDRGPAVVRVGGRRVSVCGGEPGPAGERRDVQVPAEAYCSTRTDDVCRGRDSATVMGRSGWLASFTFTDFGLSGWRWMVEGQAGTRYEAVEGGGPVKAFEPVAYEGFEPVEGDDGKVGQAAFDVCPYPLSGFVTVRGLLDSEE